MWFLKHDKHPKAIIVEWPDYGRFIQDRWNQVNLCPAGMWSESKFITLAHNALYLKGEISYQQLHKIIPVKIIDVMHAKITKHPHSMMIWHNDIDKGTDGDHAGPKSHINTAENILQALEFFPSAKDR